MFQSKRYGFHAKGSGPTFGTITVDGASTFNGAMDINAAMSVDGVLTMEAGRQLLADPGSIAAPGIAFRGRVNTGLASTAATRTSTVAGGNEAIRFEAFGMQFINGLVGSISGLVNLIMSGYIEQTEMAAPAAGAANTVRIYPVDDAGKTELQARFNTGAVQQITQEP